MISREHVPFRLAIVVVLLAVIPLLAGASPETAPQGQPVRFRTFGPDEYQSFVKNWDSNKYPVLCALVRTPAQWDTLFQPAAVMGRNRPFAPDKTSFDKEEILLVARVMAGDGRAKDAFEVESVSVHQDQLVLRYRFRKPTRQASYTVKNYVGVRIARHRAKEVVFIENGTRVATLNVAGGQWSIPEFERPKPAGR